MWYSKTLCINALYVYIYIFCNMGIMLNDNTQHGPPDNIGTDSQHHRQAKRPNRWLPYLLSLCHVFKSGLNAFNYNTDKQA